MITINVPPFDAYDEENNEFLYFKEQVITIEHCLKAIRNWESKWEKPFFTYEKLSQEETADYVCFMAQACGCNIDRRALFYLPEKQINKITDYINKKATATWFSKQKNRPIRNQQVVTAELIYYWMIEAGIPFECEYWHINQLMTLIEVCGHKAEEKNKKAEAKAKGKKRNKAASKESALRFAQLNKQRQAKYNTKG